MSDTTPILRKYTLDEVAAVKAALRDAPQVTRPAPGEVRRIAAEFGMPVQTVYSLHQGKHGASIEPAPAA
jgi:hypothetical protein